jgi:hypothetical protein
MRRYRTVIPFHNLTLEDAQPFYFAPNISIDVVPEYLKADSLLKHQSYYDLQQFEVCTHCLIFDYEAHALYSPDPLWKGPEPRPIEKANVERAYLANLALWLQHPSPTGFNLIFNMPEFGNFIIQGSERCDRFLCHPDDEGERIEQSDLEPAKLLFAALSKIPRETALWTALRALTAALQMNSEEIRYLLLWVAIEALFGTNFEIKYRISQRLAFFIANNRSEARDLFTIAKKAYDFRSKVAHGAWKEDKHSTALTASTESLIRRALVRLLKDEETTKQFLGGNDRREAYLDELVFAENL